MAEAGTGCQRQEMDKWRTAGNYTNFVERQATGYLRRITGWKKGRREALSQATGPTQDPLKAGKEFSEQSQASHEKVIDYVASLKKMFKEAYPKESATSSVLLQRFLTGLKLSIHKQALLNKDQPLLTRQLRWRPMWSLRSTLEGMTRMTLKN